MPRFLSSRRDLHELETDNIYPIILYLLSSDSRLMSLINETPILFQMHISRQKNNLVSETMYPLLIVVNDRGESPPNVSMLSCIQSIQSMSEVQVRQCLQFYGHNNSLSIQDLFVSLGVDIKSFVNDINRRAKLDNSVPDNQYLTLFFK